MIWDRSKDVKWSFVSVFGSGDPIWVILVIDFGHILAQIILYFKCLIVFVFFWNRKRPLGVLKLNKNTQF